MTHDRNMFRLTPFGSGDGMMLAPNEDAVFADLFDAGLDELLADAGHIIIRGFAPSIDNFNVLVQNYSSRITIDPARVLHGEGAQKVDSGFGSIGLHVENGASPFVGDLLWFHCIKAAASGSETTICDGYRVWNALSERAKEMFTAQPVSYSRTVPSALWRRLTAYLVGDGRDADDVSVADLHKVSNADAKVTFEELSSGDLYYNYQVYAAHPAKWSSRTAWANSLLGPSYNYEPPTMRFADGSPIPDDVVAEYTDVTARLTEEVRWEDGDIVLIDNSRVMHGRRPITDPERTILNAQSYAKD